MYLLGVKYLEALPKITEGSGTTIFLPAEATGVMGAIGGMKELLARRGASPATRAEQRRAAARPASPPPPAQLGSGARPPGADARATTRSERPSRTPTSVLGDADHTRASRAHRARARVRELRRVQLQEAGRQAGRRVAARELNAAWAGDKICGVCGLPGDRARRGRGRAVYGVIPRSVIRRSGCCGRNTAVGDTRSVRATAHSEERYDAAVSPTAGIPTAGSPHRWYTDRRSRQNRHVAPRPTCRSRSRPGPGRRTSRSGSSARRPGRRTRGCSLRRPPACPGRSTTRSRSSRRARGRGTDRLPVRRDHEVVVAERLQGEHGVLAAAERPAVVELHE